MVGASELVIDLSRHRLRVVSAEWGHGRLQVKRTISQDLPDDLDRDDPEAVGQWLSSQLKDSGIAGDRAVFALSREYVALKRMTLPTIDAVELPDMTRLALQRELPFDPEEAVIDFLPLSRGESDTTVLAVAVPESVLAYTRSLARAAGLKIQRVSLRGLGAAMLIEAEDHDPEGDEQRTLLIDVTDRSVEFSVVENGAIRFSRAAEIMPDESTQTHAESVIREIRRTWMSYRIVDEDSRVDRALLIGDGALGSDTANAVADMLQVKTRRLDAHARIDVNGAAMEGVWPLAGLLLGSNLQHATIDFMQPRKAPDVGARKRQVALALAGLFIIIAFGGWTMARRVLGPLELRLDNQKSISLDLAPKYRRYGRDKYKLEHLAQWESTKVDWLEHAAALVELLPGPESIVIDEFTGTLNFRGVTFDHKTKQWSADRDIVIVLDGEAAGRQVADAFRAALVDSNLYRTSSSGTDSEGGKRLPFGFSFRLETTIARPGAEEQGEADDVNEAASTARRDSDETESAEDSG